VSEVDEPEPPAGEVRRALQRLARREATPTPTRMPEQAPRQTGAALAAMRRRLDALHAPREAWSAPLRPQPDPTPAPMAPALPPPVPPAPEPTPTTMRARLDALRRQAGKLPEGGSPQDKRPAAAPTPHWVHGAERTTPHGPSHVRTVVYDATAQHGDREALAGLDASPAALALLAGAPGFERFDPRSALLLDLEATGLAHGAGTLPFLVGAAHFRGEALTLEQWLMTSPDDEQAVLFDLAARVRAFDWLVTFNGRTYDVPLLQSRYRLHRMDDPFVDLVGHVDLLTLTRRAFRADVPDKRLGTIERHALGLQRHEDISGAEVPECYRRWLFDRDPRPLERVVEHNRLDVLTLSTLLHEVSHRVTAPESTLLRDPDVVLGLIERARRAGQFETARRLLDAADVVPSTRARAESLRARVDRAEHRALKRAKAPC